VTVVDPATTTADAVVSFSGASIAVVAAVLGACVSAIIALWMALKHSRRSEVAALREQTEQAQAHLREQIEGLRMQSEELVKRVRSLESARLDEAKDYAAELRTLMCDVLSTITAQAKADEALREVIRRRPCLADCPTSAFLVPGKDHA